MSGDSNTLPNFIKARSAKSLRVLMLKNNQRLSMAYINYTIILDGKIWFAWYDEPIWKNEEVIKSTQG